MLSFVTIKNFKCFESFMSKIAPLTMIAGINGAGKSTMIQVLLMLRQSFIDNNIDQTAEIAINGPLVETGSFIDVLYSDAKDPEIVFEIESDKSHILRYTLHKTPSSNGLALQASCVGDIDYAKLNNSLFSDDFVYLYADRMHPQAEYNRDKRKSFAGRLGDRYGSNTPFRLMDAFNNGENLAIPGMKHSNAESQFVTENVSAWISHIMGGSVVVNAIEQSMADRVKVEYSVNTPSGISKNISPINMPFGHSYILPIVLAVLTAPKESLIIIENPESHLHPAAQTRMGAFLALAAHNGVQIIIETHSDHLMNGIRIASTEDDNIKPYDVEICYVTFDEDNYTHICERIEINPNGTLDSWPSGFFDEWELALNRLANEKFRQHQ